jgi:adaptin ear-binding coat-associated protein 1/2
MADREPHPEVTLFQCREVNLYMIPPRSNAGGYRSGDWETDKKIFTGRLRLVSIGEYVEIRMEDVSSDEIFAVCPVHRGQRNLAVEPATDSSRNFVLKVQDPETKRHAFLGLNFTERGQAFDFNVSLTDHEKHLNREAALEKGQAAVPELVTLYKSQDLRLEDGQTIKIRVNNNSTSEKGQSMTKNEKLSPSASSSSFLARLAPSPGVAIPLTGAVLSPPPPPPAAAVVVEQNKTETGSDEGWATFD